MRICIVLIQLVLLVGCGRFALLGDSADAPELTLADLQPSVVPEVVGVRPQATLAELEIIYRDVLEVTQDPATRLQVQHRLADIQMLASEERLAMAQAEPDLFIAAIDAYEKLLAENPDNPGNDRLLYQLSKAFDLRGMTDESLTVLERLSSSFPDSGHVPEAEFRKAEHYFSEPDYSRAEQAYARVIAFGAGTPYFVQAHYMHGWSLFKQGDFRTSIASFTATLDQLIPRDNQLDSLKRGERELAEDCFRVLAVVFGSLDGARTIADAYQKLGVRPYQHLLYAALGEHYLAQQRYRDSAETYRAYTRSFPRSQLAHEFALRVIESYVAGGFPDLIVAEKQHYVAAFALKGTYWAGSAEPAREAMATQLKLFITELAAFYHSLAQAIPSGDVLDRSASINYRYAVSYYQLYIDSFPSDPKTPQMGFLLAESSFEAGDYRSAIKAYEWVAYSFEDYERAADAAYSAIIAYQQIAGSDPATEARRMDSELRFASAFSNDVRAPSVLRHAATQLLENGEYQLAIIAAATLARQQTTPDIELSAWLVMGHSHFELLQFESAEHAYQVALSGMSAGDKRRYDTLERVAASMYKQAEEAVADRDYRLAANRFSRVVAVAPESKIRVAAQFDAASNFMLAGDLVQANRLLHEFRQHYPGHTLTESIPAMLVANHVQLEDWAAAANELDGIHVHEPVGEKRNQALYLAAQYYDRAGDTGQAVRRFRSYAHDVVEPFDLRLEAMNRLSELYRLEGDERKRNFWLGKMVDTHDSAVDGGSQRSLYLAAMSSSILANDRYESFGAIKLHLPLKKSVGRKKAAMGKALASYQKTNNYGVELFSTLATYRIGSIYQQMSRDLLASERPGKLDALALEQYALLLEEQAYPFEEKAIVIWEANARRSWEGVYDEWVRASFTALAEVLPARYRKKESIAGTDLELAVLNLQAIKLREKGLFAQAEQVYLAAIALREPHSDSHRNLGILYDLYMGYPNRALQHFYRYQALTSSGDRAVAGWIVDLERQITMLVKGD